MPAFESKGVSINPGQIEFILIPSVAYSSAADWVSPIIPCFAAAKAHVFPITDSPPVINTVLFSIFRPSDF
jgi:hypothetical protein